MRRAFWLFGIVLLTTSQAALALSITNLGSLGNSDYFLLWDDDGTPITWTQSQAMAEIMGGNLVTIDDIVEQEGLMALLQAVGEAITEVWIGLTDQNDESADLADRTVDGWAWIGGPLLADTGFTAWNQAGCEPSNGDTWDTTDCSVQLIDNDADEDFVYQNLITRGNFTSGEWNDASDGTLFQGGVHHAVVEVIDGSMEIPVPATLGLLLFGWALGLRFRKGS